jgi:hypothetical protein
MLRTWQLVYAQVSPCEICGGKSGTRQVFIQFSPLSIITLWLSMFIHHWGMNKRPIGDRSSETVSPHQYEQQQRSDAVWFDLLALLLNKP